MKVIWPSECFKTSSKRIKTKPLLRRKKDWFIFPIVNFINLQLLVNFQLILKSVSNNFTLERLKTNV